MKLVFDHDGKLIAASAAKTRKRSSDPEARAARELKLRRLEAAVREALEARGVIAPGR
jgi:hypothetical protein